MINIQRGEQPKSLQEAEIKRYLDDLATFKALPIAQQTKENRPSCPDYRQADLFEAFDRDFFAKCYLTEQKFANSWSMDVEHFRAKNFSQNPELRYEWTNLYPAAHDANMMKPRLEPEGGYLDPCSKTDDVEKDIIYTLGFGGEAYFKAKNDSNQKSVNTALLLERIHNGFDEKSIQKTAELRRLIDHKQREVLDTILKWQNAKLKKDAQTEFEAEMELKNLLSRKSFFTMLIRSLYAVRQYVPQEFLD